MVYRAIELARHLREQGNRVIEVYPYASKVSLWGKPIPKKTTMEGRRYLQQRLSTLIGVLDSHEGILDHDRLDALVAAYTGYLHGLGQTEALGLKDEGQIIVPRQA